MFKQKNKKLIQSDNRITLDAKHNEIIKNFKEENKNIKKYQQELDENKSKLEKLKDSFTEFVNPEELNVQFALENKIKELESKIYNLETQKEETEYFVDTGNILYNYYNNLEEVAVNPREEEKEIPKVVAKKESKKEVVESGVKITSFFGGVSVPVENIEVIEEDDNEGKRSLTISDFMHSQENFDRASTLDSYLSRIDKSYGIKSKMLKKIDFCKKCKEFHNKDYEMIINHNEGFMSCTKCGHMEYVIIESDKPNYKDPPPEATYFAYKRTNHLNEILNQIQAKESTDIPDDVLELIKEEIRKERIKDLTKLTNTKVRHFLRKLNLNKYYEHIAHIINKLNGLPPPIITKSVEDKLRHCFREIQGPWMEIAKKPKKNFLNYHYVLHKCVELLGHDEYKALFPLLKSREKLILHDTQWKLICEKLNWEFIRTI